MLCVPIFADLLSKTAGVSHSAVVSIPQQITKIMRGLEQKNLSPVAIRSLVIDGSWYRGLKHLRGFSCNNAEFQLRLGTSPRVDRCSRARSQPDLGMHR